MKKLSIFFIFIITCLLGCKEKAVPPILIEGTFKGLGTDTLLLYGFDHQYDHIDTLPVRRDHIYWELKTDTLVITMLVTDSTIYPIFLEKNCHLFLEADTASPRRIRVTGNKYNEQLSAFNDSIENKTEKETIQQAERFIRKQKTSIVSVYLLQKYFINQPKPNYALIKDLISGMNGLLQDMPIVRDMQEFIKKAERAQNSRIAPYFTLEDEKGKRILRTSEFKDKFMLMHFWNSTLPQCDTVNMKLKKLHKKFKKEKNVGFLNISVDTDYKRWLKRIEKDSLNWIQTCSPEGWHSKIIKDYNVNVLPTLILVNPEGRILKRDLCIDSVNNTLTKILKEEKLKKKNKKN